jgi:sugar lactone lactonase YvrE
MKREPRVLVDDLVFPEGPRWHGGRLVFSDMHAFEVVAVDLEGTREVVCTVEHRPSGIGFLPGGDMLVVSMEDRKVLRFDGRALHLHADLGAHAPFHLNDMVVDGKGRAYVGNFGFDLHGGAKPKTTNFHLVGADGSVREVAKDVGFPNGAVITPDGRSLILAESFGKCLTAFDIGDDGTLRNRRVWAKLDIFPDGTCLDAEGCVWAASPMAPGGFLRVAEGGEVRDRIELPDRFGFACALGGPERRHLFLLEAFGADPAKVSGRRGNGRVRVVEVDVPGAGLP